MRVINLLFILYSTAECFITRLSTRKHANFTINNGNYFTGTNLIGKTINNIDKAECSLSCIAFPTCIFANHKLDNTICQLITSGAGTLTSNSEWRFLTTDYKYSRNRGPICRSLEPCGVTQLCIDSAVDPFYTCSQTINVAKTGTATQSSVYVDSSIHSADKAIDQLGTEYITVAHTLQETDPWWKVTLLKSYDVAMIILYFRLASGSNVYPMDGAVIRIGTSENISENAYCCTLDKSSTGPVFFFCEHAVLTGNVVSLERHYSTALFIMITEFEIWALPE